MHGSEQTATIEIRELLPAETGLAFEAMRALRTSFDDESSFAHRVDEVQRPEGYRLVAAFGEADHVASAVAGFRCGHNLAWGHYIYVDDLSTRPDARRRGHAVRARSGKGAVTWLPNWIERLPPKRVGGVRVFGSV